MKRLAIASLVLAGCAGRDPIPVPDAARYGPTVLVAAPAPVKVEGLTLERALAMAREIHPDLAAARALVDAAEGRAHQAGLYPNPVLVGRMESAPFEGGTARNAEFVAGVSQRVPIGGRLGAARDAESLERERRLRESEVRALEVGMRVHAAFAAALYAEEVVRLQTEVARVAERGVAVTRARSEAGDALAEDVARTEIEELRARLELDHAGGLRDLSRAALAAAMGNPLLEIASMEGNLEMALEIPSIEAILKALDDGPYGALARAEVDAIRGRIDQARLERIPDVSLDLFYRRLEHSETDAFDAGLSVALPLFDRNQGRLRELEAEERAARGRAQGRRNEAARQVREAHIRLTEALHHARLLKAEILPRAETVLRGAEVRYTGGDMSLADVLPIRREHASSRLGYLEALREVMEAWAALKPFLDPK